MIAYNRAYDDQDRSVRAGKARHPSLRNRRPHHGRRNGNRESLASYLSPRVELHHCSEKLGMGHPDRIIYYCARPMHVICDLILWKMWSEGVTSHERFCRKQ